MISATITGRLGQDPETKHLNDGTPVVEFSIASSSSKRDGDATWVRASMFGERGVNVAKYVRKGDRFAATGTLELRSWKSREGKEGTTLEMRIDNVDFIHEKHDDQDERPAAQPSSGRPAPAQDRNRTRAPF